MSSGSVREGWVWVAAPERTRMHRTKHPGIYRRGSRYVVTYYIGGRQRKESARTLDEARRLKAARTTDAARGEFEQYSRLGFVEYATGWVERYHGRGRRGFRESTRDDYRRSLEVYAFRFFSPRLRLCELSPRHLHEFIHWLIKNPGAKGKPISDSTIRNALNPVRSCLATAVAEGLIRTNPAHGLSLPNRPTVEAVENEDVRVLTREQLRVFLENVEPRYRLLFEFLAATGLRIGEAAALQWRHLDLHGSHASVKVRRGIRAGRVEPPKTRYGRRDVPLDPTLVAALRARRNRSQWNTPDDLVFPSNTGTPLHVENVRRRILKPAAKKAGAPWCGFHTFRHTCASLLFERGRNAAQVQRWLGHHSPAFTLTRYVHLLNNDLGQPLNLTTELHNSGNNVATQATATHENPNPAGSSKPPLSWQNP